MQTRCPHCRSVFRLTVEQLAAARGQVRCGVCGRDFNALDGLLVQPQPVPPAAGNAPVETPAPASGATPEASRTLPSEDTGAAAASAAPASPAAAGPGEPSAVHPAVPSEDTGAVAASAAPAPPAAAGPGAPPDGHRPVPSEDTGAAAASAAPAPPAADSPGAPPDAHRPVPSEDSGAAAASAVPASPAASGPEAGQGRAAAPYPPHPRAAARPGGDSRPAAAATDTPGAPKEAARRAAPGPAARGSAADEEDAAAMPAIRLGSFEALEDEPPPREQAPLDLDAIASAARSSHTAESGAPPVRRGRAARFGWGLGSVLLLVLLVLQLLWFRHGDIVPYLPPPLGQLVERLCERFGCVDTAPAAGSGLKVLSSDVRQHPAWRDAVLFHARVLNASRAPQPFPVLELSLSDAGGALLGRRRFTPAQYRPPGAGGEARLQAGETISLVLELADPGDRAVAYSLVLR